MNIDQLLKEKTQILRNNLGESVMGVAVEDLEAFKNYFIRLEDIWIRYSEFIDQVESKYHGETRHETAKRLIANSQKSSGVAQQR